MTKRFLLMRVIDSVRFNIFLKRPYSKIKKRGWFESKFYSNVDGILGDTLEDYLGKKRDNNSIADYHGIELKTKDNKSKAFVSLFSISPSCVGNVSTFGCVNNYIKAKYGYMNSSGAQQLYSSVFSKGTKCRSGFKFMLKTDINKKKIWLIVEDINTGTIVEDENTGIGIYWDIKQIEKKLKIKMMKLAFVYGDKNLNNGKYYVRYTKMIYYKYTNINTFLKLIENSKICMEFKLGEWKSGKLKGQAHDHGSCFRLKNNKVFRELYDHEYIY